MIKKTLIGFAALSLTATLPAKADVHSVLHAFPRLIATLEFDQPQLENSVWNIQVLGGGVAHMVQNGENEFLRVSADEDSELVMISLRLKNNSSTGQSFDPRDRVKVIVGGNTYDVEDLPSYRIQNDWYFGNVEPHVSRVRVFYAEVATEVLHATDNFSIQIDGETVETVKIIKRAETVQPQVE